MRFVVLLAATAGCSQVFGLEAPQRATVDAAVGDAPADAVVDVGPDAIMTRTFAQGIGGYTSAIDTYLDEDFPTSSQASANELRVRNGFRFGLLRFGELFAADGIPLGATIVSASLTYSMSASSCDMNLYESAIPWSATVTYATHGMQAGMQAEDIGMLVVENLPISGRPTVDVTASLARWAAEPGSDHGWVFFALSSGGASECRVRSSESPMSERPTLAVTYY